MVLKSPLERTQAFSTPRKPTAGIPASNVEDALKYIKENASGGLASVEDDPAPRLGGDLNLNGHQIVGLAAVATSGSYSDLTGKPTLGTSAALNVDTDGAMAANSDTRVPSQKAVRTYLDARIAALDVVEIKGGIDCSSNPNYPAADAGYLYKVTVAGKIGGASGPNVEAGDTLLCFVDGSSSGNQAAVGANWTIVQVNIDGAVIGPGSSTSGNVATFNGTGGKLLQDGGKALPSGAIVGTSDTQTLTNKTFDTAGAGNVLKVNGTQISDKTGTGKAVLDTSPTITNNQTISQSAAQPLASLNVSTTATGSGETHISKFCGQDSIAGGGFIRALFFAAGPLNGGVNNQGQFDIINENGSIFLASITSLSANNGSVLTLYDRSNNIKTILRADPANVSYISSGLVVGGSTGNGASNFRSMGSIGTAAPVTVTASTYTVGANESDIIFNTSTTHTLTLPSASANPGRFLFVKTIAAFAVNSASSNVCPISSATPGTAILAATAGKWATLKSDGTNWIVMAAN